MAPSVRRIVRAEDDLVDVWLYLAQDDAQAADPLLEALNPRNTRLAEHPHLGRARSDRAPELHFFSVGNYLTLFRLSPPKTARWFTSRAALASLMRPPAAPPPRR